jgi:RNA polymerase sigma-70 factor, ECF subfamily
VSAIIRPNEAARSDPDGTLGQLLYADPSRARIPESEWQALVSATGAGDPLALHALYLRMHRLVYTLAVRITGHRETAEEVTVDVFHDVWRRAATYDAQAGTVVGWIMNQARSRAIDRLRFEQRKKRMSPLNPQEMPSASTVPDASAAVELAQLSGILRHGLADLSAAERESIELAFFSEMTQSEVAARLQQPLGTIKTRIRSGLVKLRQILGSRGDRP